MVVLRCALLFGLLPALVSAGAAQQHAGPSSPGQQPAWLAALKADREATIAKINYTGGVFDQLTWTQSSWIQPQMHPYDRFFFDPSAGYTVDKWLQDLDDRYGGVDSILMWPTYTNIGIDDRNQFDLFRAMPGGLDAVANVTAQLHAKGVKVLWPYNPWDHGTRREDNQRSDEDTYGALLKQTNGDGFNGDTMGYVPYSFWAAAEKVNHSEAFEPEGGGEDESLNWSTMGWGYYGYPQIPQVDRFKFITKGKFMTNICDRWAFRKTDNLQTAWFNGAGYESWENVWGTWNGITPRDGEAIRRVGSMLRFFGEPDTGLLHSEDWEPHTPACAQPGVYCSVFPGKAGDKLWTVVNRAGANFSSSTQQIIVEPQSATSQFWDCYHGSELKLQPAAPVPAPTMPPKGYNFYGASSCYNEHGGTEMDNSVPFTTADAASCTAKCDESKECSCVTFDAASNHCWRRSQCEPAGFQKVQPGSYDTYVKAVGYSTYPAQNCYGGHGGVMIDSDATAPVGLTTAQCEARCDKDPKCSCATFKASNGKCWKRASCNPSSFEAGNAFTVLLSQARVPRPAPAPQPAANASAVAFELEAEGFGCVLETSSINNGLIAFLDKMKTMTASPLLSISAEWRYLNQTLVPIAATKTYENAPAGTVKIPKTDAFRFQSRGVMIEGDDQHGVGEQYPWEPHPAREHNHTMPISSMYMHKYPVTTANYSTYLQATKYQPDETYNWLKNWQGQQTPPQDLLDKPVTYVSLTEARLYCAWAGGRLPHSYEWQYAAQGTDSRAYPWGSTKDQSKYPTLTTGNTFNGPESVTAHAPAGDSPFGVSDLVGNVWQYTSEFQDAHTRAVVTQGGSNYRPSGSNWYYPQAVELYTHNKYFLMSDTYERAGTVGFRCVFDAE